LGKNLCHLGVGSLRLAPAAALDSTNFPGPFFRGHQAALNTHLETSEPNFIWGRHGLIIDAFQFVVGFRNLTLSNLN